MNTLLAKDFAPQVNPSVASVQIGDEHVIAHEGCVRPRLLAPIDGVLWQSFDGSTTVGDLTDDLVAATGESRQYCLERVSTLTASLIEDGFLLNDDGHAVSIRPRRLDLPLDPQSCVGRRIGLGRMTTIDVELDGRRAFRLGASDHGVMDELIAALPSGTAVEPDPTIWLRTLWLRVTVGRTRRLQQLFDTVGDLLYASHSADEGVEALGRSVAALKSINSADARPAVWINSPAIRCGDGAILAHPGLHRFLTGELRQRILFSSSGFIPSAMVEVRAKANGYEAVLPASLTGSGPTALPVISILVPQGPPSSSGDAVRRLAHLAQRWDPAHLAAIPKLANHPSVQFLPADATIDDLARIVAR